MTTAWHMIYTNSPKSIGLIRNAFFKRGLQVDILVPETTEVKPSEEKEGELETIASPMFPGYIFVKFDYQDSSIDSELLEQKAGFLLKAPGAKIPATIPDDEIERIKIKAVEESQRNMMKKTEAVECPSVKVGQFVDITNGPFIGFKGVVLSVKKLIVEVEIFIFGRATSTEVPIDHILLVERPPEDHPEIAEEEGLIGPSEE